MVSVHREPCSESALSQAKLMLQGEEKQGAAVWTHPSGVQLLLSAQLHISITWEKVV